MFEPFLFIWVFIIMTLQVIAKYDHMYNTHFQRKCGHTRKKKKRFTCDHTCKVCVIQSYLFWIIYNVNNMYTQKKKKCCSLRSPAAPRGARLPLISPWSMASWWKKPCNFPLTLCATVKIDISSSYLFHLIKTVVFANIGRAHLCDSLGAQSRIC